MTLSRKNIPMFHLKPGEIHFSERPSVVMTILGSCVSVTMFNRRLGVAAICHAQLPKVNPGKCCLESCPETGRMNIWPSETFKYVDCSICYMRKRFGKLGIKRNEIEVKLFGGADVLPSRTDNGKMTIGSQNIETALRVINGEQLRLLASKIGGNSGYKIFFHTHTGEVFLRHVKKVVQCVNPEKGPK